MPYITKHRRAALWPLDIPKASTAGELNFQITSLVDRYIKQSGVSYATLNEAIGVLECAKLELYRRLAVPYEDKKCSENGDVYT